MLRNRSLFAAIAGLLAVALVSLGASLNGATATTLSADVPPPSVTSALAAVDAIDHADLAALVMSSPTIDADGRFTVPATAPVGAVRGAAAMNDLVDAGAIAGAARDFFGNNPRTVNEFLYWVNDGNRYVLAAVGMWTNFWLPLMLVCPIGQAANCAIGLTLIAATLSALALVNAAFSYVRAVQELPT